MSSRFLLAGIVILGAASAHAFQFSVLSSGTFDNSSGTDTESVLFSHWVGVSPIDVTTLFLNGNSSIGFLAGPGGTDTLNFTFVNDNGQNFDGSINDELSWQYTSGTGAFAGLTGQGSISFDAQYVDGVTYNTTSGMTGELVATPEPASFVALGLGALILARRRRLR